MYISPHNDFFPFSNTKYNDIVAQLKLVGKRKKVKFGETILSEGVCCDFFFYIEQGCFRTFRYEKEKEINIGFTFKGDLDTCPYSFINDLSSLDFIEALTDSSIIIITKAQLKELESKNSEVIPFVNFMLSSYIETLIKRITEFKASTAEEIYLRMLQRQSKELSNIPLKHLASYLGITPERLSRIRKKYANLT